MNYRLGFRSSFDKTFNPRATPYVEPNLIDLDDPADSETTSANPKEVHSKIGSLKKWIAEEEAKCIHLEKEKEQASLDATIERDALLTRMVSLKEQNKKLEENTTTLHTDVFGDVDNLRAKV